MKPSFRVIYNQDCTNLFSITREPITPEHVDRMVDEVAEGGADVMLINPQAQRANYPSRAWQTFWDGYAAGRREFFGPVPDSDVPVREHWVAQMKRLADGGCDYLARALARCRETGLTPGVSVRMNDVHDVPWPGSHLFSRFYLEHPEWLLQNPEICGWSRAGLNYRHVGVREHFLTLIRELVGEYDIDVLDLDFLRFHCYFPREGFDENRRVMTAFVRSIREIVDGASRRITLMARVAVTPAAAYDLGFDVATWAREGLIDAVAAGAFLNTCWHIDVDAFKRLVGDRVSVYASTDFKAGQPTYLPEQYLPLDERRLRGFAAGHRAAGADGIYVFNFFCARELAPRRDPLFNVLRELGDPEALLAKPKTYSLMTGWNVAEVDGTCPVDREAPMGRPQRFSMLLAEEPAAGEIEVQVLVRGDLNGPPDQFWLHVNECSAGVAASARPVLDADVDQPVHAITFRTASRAIHHGRNDLVLRNDGATVTVLAIDVCVR